MNLSNFSDRLSCANRILRELTKDYVYNKFPKSSRYISLNYGDRLRFDDWTSLSGDEFLEKMWDDGHIPRWIEMNAGFVDRNHLYICAVIPAEKIDAAEAQLTVDRHSPFKCLSPVLPPGWSSVESDGKFDLNRKRKFL